MSQAQTRLRARQAAAPPEPSPAAPIIEYYDSAEQIGPLPPLAAQQAVQVLSTPVGIYGWRKYGLYAAVLLLLALAIINLGLLVWIANVLSISADRAGPVLFEADRIQVSGPAEFTQGLAVANLSGFDAAELLLQSNADVRLQASADSGSSGSQIVVSAGTTQVTTASFQAAPATNNASALPYLQATTDAITLRATQVQVDSASGMTVSGSLQANVITNAYSQGQGLSLESVGQDMTLTASQDVDVASTFGAVTVQALSDVTLTAGGNIKLQANGKIVLANLPVPSGDASASQFQLCMCAADQRLYRVSSTNTCENGAAAVGC